MYRDKALPTLLRLLQVTEVFLVSICHRYQDQLSILQLPLTSRQKHAYTVSTFWRTSDFMGNLIGHLQNYGRHLAVDDCKSAVAVMPADR